MAGQARAKEPRTTARKTRQTEAQTQKASVRALRALLRPEVIFYHIPNGEKRNVATGRKLKDMGVLPGVPDLFLFYAGKCYYIEMKAGGSLSASQISFMAKAEDNGADCAVCRSVRDVIDQVDNWGLVKEGIRL